MAERIKNIPWLFERHRGDRAAVLTGAAKRVFIRCEIKIKDAGV